MRVTNKENIKPRDCNTSILQKFADSRNRKPDAKANTPLDLVHTYFSGPVEPISHDSLRYCTAFTDDYSGAVAVYFFKNKCDEKSS